MNVKPYFLNFSVMSEQADSSDMESAVRRHLAPVARSLGEDAVLMRLGRIQGGPLPTGHPCSLVLQLRFATATEREDFRNGPMCGALANLYAEMPQDKCMVFETMLDGITL